MIIRLATKKDCISCAELSKIKELKDPHGDFISEEYFRNFVDVDEMFFVAEDNNKIVGYILGEPLKCNLALLGLLTVSEKFRGQGIGKQLIKAFRDSCDNHNVEYIFFYAPNFNKNTIEFYKKQGFVTNDKLYSCFGENRKK